MLISFYDKKGKDQFYHITEMFILWSRWFASKIYYDLKDVKGTAISDFYLLKLAIPRRILWWNRSARLFDTLSLVETPKFRWMVQSASLSWLPVKGKQRRRVVITGTSSHRSVTSSDPRRDEYEIMEGHWRLGSLMWSPHLWRLGCLLPP